MNFDEKVEKYVPRFLYQLGKYSGVGLFTLLINLGVTILLTEYVGIQYLISAAIGYVAGLMAGFFLHKFFTFGNKDKRYLREVPLFLLTYIVGFMVNLVGVYAFVEFASIAYQAGVLFAGMISGFVTFCLNKWMVFQK